MAGSKIYGGPFGEDPELFSAGVVGCRLAQRADWFRRAPTSILAKTVDMFFFPVA